MRILCQVTYDIRTVEPTKIADRTNQANRDGCRRTTKKAAGYGPEAGKITIQSGSSHTEQQQWQKDSLRPQTQRQAGGDQEHADCSVPAPFASTVRGPSDQQH